MSTATEFFEQALQHTIEGFFADPIYGGNREMVSWKLIGFPGARYDYRDFVTKTQRALSAPSRQHSRARRVVGTEVMKWQSDSRPKTSSLSGSAGPDRSSPVS